MTGLAAQVEVALRGQSNIRQLSVPKEPEKGAP
jgi:hypothetical protein